MREVVDATGEAGLGELYWGVPGATAEDEPIAAGVSKVSLTVWSIVWSILIGDVRGGHGQTM